MECYVKSNTHRTLDYLQNFNSLIWTERYSSFGDFELLMPIDTPLKNSLVVDNHLHMVGSNYVMMIDSVKYKKNRSENFLQVKGRSLEHLLERRSVLKDINMPTSSLGLMFEHLEQCFRAISVIDGSVYDEFRHVPGFQIDKTVPSGVVERPVWDYEFEKMNMYEVVKRMCDDHELGFRLALQTDNTLRFNVYKGSDRSVLGSPNAVIFSFEMHNMKSLEYIKTNKNLSTVAIPDYGKDGYAVPRLAVYAGSSEPKGLARREMLVNSAELARNWSYGATPSEMSNLLAQSFLKSMIELRMSKEDIVLDAEIENGKPPHYGSGYRLGDIVRMYHNAEANTRYRVTEFIRSYSPNGASEYPTFEALPED